MSRFNTTLNILSGALFAAGLVTTSAWAQTAKPAMPADPSASAPAPATRAEVKAEAKSAQRAGDMPQGEAGTTKDHPKGGATATGPTAKKGEMTRADVKAEGKRAAAAGEVPAGEGLATKNRPEGGPKMNKGSDTSRAEVKAEAKRAEQAGELPKGEGGAAIKPTKPL